MMQFELNGIRRDVAVKDKSIEIVSDNVKYADIENDKHIGSSIPGLVSKTHVKRGDKVEKNQLLFVIEAMKMETSVVALAAGVVDEVFVRDGQSVKAGELLATLK